MSSCSTLENKDNSLIGLINRMCFNSEGRGRIETPQGRYVFSYESVLNKDESKWSFAFHFPLGRQEVLHLVFKPKPKAEGLFYRKVYQSLSEADRIELKKFLGFITSLAKMKETQKEVKGFVALRRDGGAILKVNDDHGESPYLSLMNDDKYFRKITVQYENEAQSNLKLLLFQTSCTES